MPLVKVMVTVAVLSPVELGVKVIKWFKGVSFPFRLPRFELEGVKSEEPLIATTILLSWFPELPPVAVLSNTNVLTVLLPVSTSPKSVLLVVEGVTEPFETVLPLPVTARVP